MKTSTFMVEDDDFATVRVEPFEIGVAISQDKDRIEISFSGAVELGEALRVVGLEGLRNK